MSYVVYEKESTKFISNLNGGPKNKNYFGTMRAAKAARTKFLKSQLVYTEEDILIAKDDVFIESIEKQIEGKSALDGSPVTVRANTPYCSDPRYERYWSM